MIRQTVCKKYTRVSPLAYRCNHQMDDGEQHIIVEVCGFLGKAALQSSDRLAIEIDDETGWLRASRRPAEFIETLGPDQETAIDAWVLYRQGEDHRDHRMGHIRSDFQDEVFAPLDLDDCGIVSQHHTTHARSK